MPLIQSLNYVVLRRAPPPPPPLQGPPPPNNAPPPPPVGPPPPSPQAISAHDLTSTFPMPTTTSEFHTFIPSSHSVHSSSSSPTPTKPLFHQAKTPSSSTKGPPTALIIFLSLLFITLAIGLVAVIINVTFWYRKSKQDEKKACERERKHGSDYTVHDPDEGIEPEVGADVPVGPKARSKFGGLTGASNVFMKRGSVLLNGLSLSWAKGRDEKVQSWSTERCKNTGGGGARGKGLNLGKGEKLGKEGSLAGIRTIGGERLLDDWAWGNLGEGERLDNEGSLGNGIREMLDERRLDD
ncbi:hypothetical protein M422DRAFT_262463 [Sphaerobolus stellatus SS14]|uniref:Uncharacterized protein n=1 Tax=Sphaerobolus stellatus (strain SS14) TaxID=990650 RepID=A0A0C9V112_SPHS4|nr:hypothetical protein M422DRAFT_262463 [Sphaerobolus stellatus SS14]